MNSREVPREERSRQTSCWSRGLGISEAVDVSGRLPWLLTSSRGVGHLAQQGSHDAVCVWWEEAPGVFNSYASKSLWSVRKNTAEVKATGIPLWAPCRLENVLLRPVSLRVIPPSDSRLWIPPPPPQHLLGSGIEGPLPRLTPVKQCGGHAARQGVLDWGNITWASTK